MIKYLSIFFLVLVLNGCGKNLPSCEDEGVQTTVKELFLNSQEIDYKNLLDVTFNSISDEGKSDLSNTCKARIHVSISTVAQDQYVKFNNSSESKFSRKFPEIDNKGVDYLIDYSVKKNKIDDKYIIELNASTQTSSSKLDYSALSILKTPDNYIEQLEKLHAVDKFEEWLKSSPRNGSDLSNYIRKNQLISVKKCAMVMRGFAESFDVTCYVGNDLLTVSTMHKWVLGKLTIWNASSYVSDNWGMNYSCMNAGGNTASNDELKLINIFNEAQDGISYIKTNEQNSVNLTLTGCRI
jgi:hypothetical protein